MPQAAFRKARAVTLTVSGIAAAGHAYARARRHARLPPVKGTARAVPSDEGPVLIVCGGVTYTLFINGVPATGC